MFNRFVFIQIVLNSFYLLALNCEEYRGDLSLLFDFREEMEARFRDGTARLSLWVI